MSMTVGGLPGARDPDEPTAAAWRAANAELRLRLQEAEETLAAIRQGDVDALVVGNDVYTLDSSNAAANRMRQDVLTQMEDAVFAFDVADHLVFMNAAAERHYRLNASMTLGRLKAEVFEEIWPDEDATLVQLLQQGVFRGNVIHRLKQDATEAHVEVTISLLRDVHGTPSGQLHVIRNIDDRVRTERSIAAAAAEQEKVNAALRESQARLQEADSRKDEFLATLAHELRNPLAPIRNALEIMRLTPEAELQASARSIVERQLAQMVHLVDDLLDISRISRGKLELRYELADVAQVVQSAIETSRPLIEAGKHELSVRLPLPRSLMVEADVTRLCQVLANLLNNAAKYTPEGGCIDVVASREGERAVVTVKDNGVGIPAAMLPKVFDMFTQVDRNAQHSQGGLGIGLALVKQLVEMHGGEVDAHSDGPGSGSTFAVRLPLAQLATAPGEPSSPSRLRLGKPHGCRVLVVDDNIDSAVTMATLLDLLGYETATAHDGQEALRQAQAFAPQVILLDIGLPLLSGHEVAQEIRSRDWGRDILLIALSGWGQEGDKQMSKSVGFDRHFTKPVDLDELSLAIATVNGRRSPN